MQGLCAGGYNLVKGVDRDDDDGDDSPLTYLTTPVSEGGDVSIFGKAET